MTEGILRASTRRGGILEEWMWVLRPYSFAAMLVLERSVGDWISQLVVVCLSLLVVREDLVGLLNLPLYHQNSALIIADLKASGA